jgi:hypothetical protein
MSGRQFARELSSATGLFLFALTGLANADELPVEVLAEIPAAASVAQSGYFYSWVDGSPQSIKLALSNPGLTLPVQIMAPTWAPLRSSDPVATGFGTRGAVGFVVPGRTLPSFAFDTRVQLAMSYVAAGAMQPIDPSRAGSDFRLYDAVNLGCGAVAGCFGSGASATGYFNWQAELKGTTDLKFGQVVVSPSVAFYAKDAQSQQSIFLGTASSNWEELGGKLEIDSSVELTRNSLFGLRGSVGTAYRATSFTSAPILGDASLGPGVSSGTATASGSPLLANAEASLIWKPLAWQTIKFYGGMQFDSRVPLAPDALGIDPGTGGGSAITFEPLRSLYFGSSFKVRLE